VKKWLEKLWSSKKETIESKHLGPQPGGEIRFAVGIDTEPKKVLIIFHKPVEKLSLSENEAEHLALLLIRKSTIIREVKREEAGDVEDSQGQRPGPKEDRPGSIQEKEGKT